MACLVDNSASRTELLIMSGSPCAPRQLQVLDQAQAAANHMVEDHVGGCLAAVWCPQAQPVLQAQAAPWLQVLQHLALQLVSRAARGFQLAAGLPAGAPEPW